MQVVLAFGKFALLSPHIASNLIVNGVSVKAIHDKGYAYVVEVHHAVKQCTHGENKYYV